jgi:hypothetical protein
LNNFVYKKTARGRLAAVRVAVVCWLNHAMPAEGRIEDHVHQLGMIDPIRCGFNDQV